MSHLSEVRLDREALVSNVQALRGMVPTGARLGAVVKGNAYGHGMREVVSVLEGVVDCFQVDDLDELRAFREITSKPCLVLGYIPIAGVIEAVRLGCELALYDVARIPFLQAAAQDAGVPVKAHLKVDALLGRQGLLPDALDSFLATLGSGDGIELVAAYAHFANIEDTTDLSHALAQRDTFEACHRKIRDSGWPDLGRHLSSTAGLMTMEEGCPNDLVRLGVGVYGLYPSAALARSHGSLGLQPVMTWVSHLAQVKTLPVGHPVGYGLTFIAPREVRIGIVPQGYADGFDRGLSNVGEVLIRGRRCSVLGRVAMNMFAVDLSALPDAAAEDEVVLLGRQGGQQITAEEIALRIGTIHYEITTRISPLLPRSVV